MKTKNHLFFSYRFPDQSDPVCIQGTPSFGSSWPKSWSSTRHWGILCQCPRHCIRQCWFPNQVYRYCYSLQQQGRQVHWTHVVVFGPWSFASSWFHFPWIAMGCYAGMYSRFNFVLLHLFYVQYIVSISSASFLSQLLKPSQNKKGQKKF